MDSIIKWGNSLLIIILIALFVVLQNQVAALTNVVQRQQVQLEEAVANNTSMFNTYNEMRQTQLNLMELYGTYEERR